MLYICKPNGRFMNETKSFILETSFKLFLQKSFKEVTMKEIVKETGLSKGAFYHYFESKEQLFNEIVDTYYMNFFAIDYSKFNQQSLYEFYHDYLNYVNTGINELTTRFDAGKNQIVINYYLLIFDALNLYPGFLEKAQEMTKREFAYWVQIVKTARENGEINTLMTDEQIARIFVSSNDGIGLHEIMFGRVNDMSKTITNVWDGFYSVIKA